MVLKVMCKEKACGRWKERDDIGKKGVGLMRQKNVLMKVVLGGIIVFQYVMASEGGVLKKEDMRTMVGAGNDRCYTNIACSVASCQNGEYTFEGQPYASRSCSSTTSDVYCKDATNNIYNCSDSTQSVDCAKIKYWAESNCGGFGTVDEQSNCSKNRAQTFGNSACP